MGVIKKVRKNLASKKALRRRYRKIEVCKPCWELKYCPYGVMVETMPLLHGREDPAMKDIFGETQEEMYVRAKRALATTDFQNDDDIWHNMFFVLYADTHKWDAIKDYNPRDVSCRFWGHVCPVYFYSYQNVTETREVRRHSRHIPREIMLKVVRRDNYRCRQCGQVVDDRDIEFDHVIPHSKGGPTSVENIRLLCSGCNQKKSDSLAEILHSDYFPATKDFAESDRSEQMKLKTPETDKQATKAATSKRRR